MEFCLKPCKKATEKTPYESITYVTLGYRRISAALWVVEMQRHRQEFVSLVLLFAAELVSGFVAAKPFAFEAILVAPHISSNASNFA
jgi:hypothetical protein